MWRAKLLFFIYLVFFALIIIRLFFWQVLSFEKLAASADNQYFQSLTLPAERGEIFSADNFPLVSNKQSFLLFAETKKIEDKNFSGKISRELEIPEASISSKILPSLVWVALAHKIPREKKEAIEKLNLKGIGFLPESSRFYPEGSASAQLLGFVASDENGSDKGYFGLEGYYDRELSGRPGLLKQEKDVWGRPILSGERVEEKAQDGSSLTLFLDRNLQFMVEKKLKEAMEIYGAKAGSVVVMDPASGGILAMASYPFDQDLYKNPIISDFYEPGSTFKVVVMAAAIDQNLIKPTDIYDDSSSVRVSDYIIRTWNDVYHGKETVAEIIQHSCNTGMVWVGKKIGANRLYDYLKKFGFAEKTGIDLQGEAEPVLRPKNDWKEIDLATASFGQGIAVTPLQMLNAVNVIANKGRLLRPEVVSEVIEANAKTKKIETKIIRQAIKPETAEAMTQMMINAVENGEAKWAKPKGYKIAGKTGTAQIPVSGHYDPERTIASFVGFGPADKPKFTMLVRLTEPQSSPWAAETAAPLFFKISKELFNYYGIAPND